MASRDRLAAIRARRAQDHELSDMTHREEGHTNGYTHTSTGAPTFLSEVASIQEGIDAYNENVRRIATLRLHSLNALDTDAERDMSEVEELTQATRTLSQGLKERIQRLESAPVEGDVQIRNNHIGLLRSKFLEAIQNYQRVEQEGRVKVRQRAERQVRIVNPQATEEEINTIVEGGGQQIFAQALTNSTQYAESRNAYREVQQRQQDLHRMENTLVELAQLFNDVGTLVEQQDPVVEDIQKTAIAVQEDTEKGLAAEEEAVRHARSARRKRWICFVIFLICLAVLAIVLGVVIGGRN